MEQHNIHNYLEKYFQLNRCDMLENDGKSLHVRLSVELDKRLMNRPFYWQYVETTGADAQPMELKIVTEQTENDKKEGEFIHFGSPRLHQIFQSTKELGGFIRLYEDIGDMHGRSIALEPWLGLNMKVSYQCDRKKDMLVSPGLHLISGKVVNDFDDHLAATSMTPKIPNFCFTISPLIKLQSGIKRIERMVENAIQNDDHSWADEARERWEQDLDLLDRFYENEQEKPESYYSEKEALRQQYEPKIKVEIINGGLFYLTKGTSQHH
jgi:hypothetical protein